MVEAYRPKVPNRVAGDKTQSGAFVSVSGDIVPPRKLVSPSPQYSEIARKARITGVVELEVRIDEFGNVRDARVIRGLPMGLDQAAIDAVMRWKYQPATRDGTPVEVFEKVDMHFSLQ